MIWSMTCRACPEQYDIYNGNKLIAYFRLRHGNLYVYPYVNNEIDWDTVIYSKSYNDERGYLFENELEKLIPKIEFYIHWYLIKQWFKNLF